MPWFERHFERGIDHFLGGDGGERGHAGDRLGGLQRLVEQVVGRHDAGDQAGALGLLGVHHPAGQAHFHRLGLADRARQPLRAAHARA